MRTLEPSDLLRIFDQTAGQPPLEPASTLLAAVSPQEVREVLSAIPLGRRNGRFLALFRHLFGAGLELCSTCPVCDKRVDFGIAVDDLLASMPADDVSGGLEQAVGDLVVRYRLLTADDLAAVDRRDVQLGRRQLVDRCLLEVRRAGQPARPDDLSSAEIDLLGNALDAADPLADVRFDLTCPACQGAWQASLDIAACLADELRLRVRHLLQEIHGLARGYGWHEAEILALSSERRHAYLEMLG